MGALVAIVGRPNVGKSTLFNRLTRSRKAIVDNRPGVTRDRNYGRAEHMEKEFMVVDTGGFSRFDPDDFVDQIHYQTRQAIEEADVVCMMVDGLSGFSPVDQDMLELLRPLDKPVFFLVNKIDGPKQEHLASDFAGRGMEPVMPVSAAHGYGVQTFLDQLIKALPGQAKKEGDGLVRVAVVGRPNVGKSSFINRVAGSDRVMVSDVPGTTRDSVDLVVQVNKKQYMMVDTAGIRKKGKVRQKLEKFSVMKALKSMERCDVALLMFDAEEGMADQDQRIAGYAHERGCGVIIIANKWDLVEAERKDPAKYEKKVRHLARFLSFAPFVTISAKTGQRTQKIFNLVDQVYEQYCARFGTGPINRLIENAVQRHEPPMAKGRRLKFYYATQVTTCPPTFVCFVNFPRSVHFSYERYLVNALRAGTGLDKTPIRLYFRSRARRDLKNPGAGRPEIMRADKPGTPRAKPKKSRPVNRTQSKKLIKKKRKFR